MKWENINEKKPKDGEKVIIWADNLSDPKSSRHYCAVYDEFNGQSFIDVYPMVWDKLFKSENDYKNSDLEGDKLQVTYWMFLPIKLKK